MAEALNGTSKAELVGLHGPWRSRRQLEMSSSNGDRYLPVVIAQIPAMLD